MGEQSLSGASPHWLHAFVLWSPEGVDAARYLPLIDLPQLDAGTARTLFWEAAGASEQVTRYDLNRALAARNAGFAAPWFEVFDRIGRRAAQSGFASAMFRSPEPSPKPLGTIGPSPAELRDAEIERLHACHARGRMDWALAKSLTANSGEPFDPAVLTKEERQSLPPQLYGRGSF